MYWIHQCKYMNTILFFQVQQWSSTSDPSTKPEVWLTNLITTTAAATATATANTTTTFPCDTPDRWYTSKFGRKWTYAASKCRFSIDTNRPGKTTKNLWRKSSFYQSGKSPKGSKIPGPQRSWKGKNWIRFFFILLHLEFGLTTLHTFEFLGQWCEFLLGTIKTVFCGTGI